MIELSNLGRARLGAAQPGCQPSGSDEKCRRLLTNFRRRALLRTCRAARQTARIGIPPIGLSTASYYMLSWRNRMFRYRTTPGRNVGSWSCVVGMPVRTEAGATPRLAHPDRALVTPSTRISHWHGEVCLGLSVNGVWLKICL